MYYVLQKDNLQWHCDIDIFPDDCEPPDIALSGQISMMRQMPSEKVGRSYAVLVKVYFAQKYGNSFFPRWQMNCDLQTLKHR
jgi:hypothetical protein